MSSQKDSPDNGPRPRGLRFNARVLTRVFRRPLRLLAAFRIFRVKVIGRENVPPKGAVIIACNHISIADPVYFWGAMRRAVIALAMIELWKVPGLRWVLNRTGQIPVDRRNPGDGPVAKAIDVLRHDGAVLIFPEGKCSSSVDDLLPFRGGVATMALETGTPIVPAAIYGSNRVKPLQAKLWRINPQARVCTVFGDRLIDPKDFTGANAKANLLAALRAEILALLVIAKQHVEPPDLQQA